MNTSSAGSQRPQRPGTGLRIGELATVAGVTVRAIRHYHARGLLAEPPRDASGYRRYGAGHLVTLVRISRLRAVGMPLEQIAATLNAAPQPRGRAATDLRAALTALAEEMTLEISRITAVRDQLLIMARGRTDDPAEAFAAALRDHGLLTAGAALPAREQQAVELVDALHPQGIQGVLSSVAPLLADPGRRAALAGALERFASLSDQQVDAVAHELAEALPLPAQPAASVNPSLVAGLAGAKLTAAQQRCLLQVRALQESRMRDREAQS
jgi:DNA-binding transcriptional MerR regulator